MTITNPIGLIGDFINTIPIMVDLAKINSGLNVIIHPEIKQLFQMIPKKYGIRQVGEGAFSPWGLDISDAFEYSHKNGFLHMTQCYHHQFGMDTPKEPIRPQLESRVKSFIETDYVLAPFSRSLPEEQKWQKEKWQDLVDSLPEKRFILFGNSKYDDVNYLEDRPNLVKLYDKTFFNVVLPTMKASRGGVISVVTGISHLCYALEVKNYLFTNQGVKGWGINPEAIKMSKNIHDISVEDVLLTLSLNDK